MPDYWIKLYHEIIDDPKMAVLPDRLWRRLIELYLLAGKLCTDKSGRLPDTRQLAWLLRMDTDDLQADISQLVSTGIVESIPEGWLIVNFNKRQSAATGTERLKQHRERKQKQQYYDSSNELETNLKRNVTQINRLTESETESEQNNKGNYPAEIALYRTITGLIPDVMTYDQVRENIASAFERRGMEEEAFETYMRGVYHNWCGTKTKEGRAYSPANPKWIEWAIAGRYLDNDKPKAKRGKEGGIYA